MSIEVKEKSSTKDNKSKYIGFVEAYEEEQAKEIIKENLGFDINNVYRPTGFQILVKIYIRPEDYVPLKNDDGSPILNSDGKPVHLILPNNARAEDAFRKCAALVLSCGPDAYEGKRFEKSGPWCRVGDWITIPRNEGTQFKIRGIPVQTLPDDRVLGVIADPTDVELC